MVFRTVIYHNRKMTLNVKRYNVNDEFCFHLVSDHQPYDYITVNLPDVSKEDDEVFINNHTAKELKRELYSDLLVREKIGTVVNEFDYNFIKITTVKLSQSIIKQLRSII